MEDALLAADEIYTVALQILNENGVEPTLVPLVIATAMQRLAQFAIGSMAHSLHELRHTTTTPTEVQDG